MSWIVSKRRATVLLSLIEAETSVKLHVLLGLWNVVSWISQISRFFEFESGWCEIFLICESTCHLTNVPASINDSKTVARRFDTPRHFTISKFRVISPQTPKCGDLARAGINAFDTVGNQGVRKRKILNTYLKAGAFCPRDFWIKIRKDLRLAASVSARPLSTRCFLRPAASRGFLETLDCFSSKSSLADFPRSSTKMDLKTLVWPI